MTLDVTSLYTNIPDQEGMRACAKALARERPLHSKPSISNIIQLMRLVLTLNNFDDENYLQVGGTAMGTRLAPSYANLFMAEFEDNTYTPSHTNHIGGKDILTIYSYLGHWVEKS